MPGTKRRKSAKSQSIILPYPQTNHSTIKDPLVFLRICQDRLKKMTNEQGISPSNLEEYFHPEVTPDQLTLQRIFLQLISSAANAKRLRNVINIHGQDKTRRNKILFLLTPRNLDPLENYDQPLSDKLFRQRLEFFSQLNVDTSFVNHSNKGLISDNSDNLSKRWLTSLKDSAEFLLRYQTGKEFVDQISRWIQSILIELRFAVPMFIASNIHGIGFALACDALKDMGFCEFAKPDVHICNVFFELGLAQRSNNTLNNQLHVLESFYKLVEIINQNSPDKKITPYALDKMIWLCCTGNFYKDNGGKISKNRI